MGDPVVVKDAVGAGEGTAVGKGFLLGTTVGEGRGPVGALLGGADGTDSVGKGVGLPLEVLGCTVGTRVGLWVDRRCGD